MKFGKLLKDQISEVPQDLKAKFLSYKELKRQLKGFQDQVPGETAVTVAVAEEDASAATAVVTTPQEKEATRPTTEDGAEGDKAETCEGEKVNKGTSNGKLTPEELSFVSKLNLEIIKFNDYFIKREEELIIRVKDLGDRLKVSSSEAEGISLRNESVHVHGELVLLLHWCELNYIGLVKILKKHDKKTGLLLRSPYLANVVQQPFCSTTFLKRLVKQVEDIIFAISPEARQNNEEELDHKPASSSRSSKDEGVGAGAGLNGVSTGSSTGKDKEKGSLPQLVSNLGSDEDTLIEEEESSLLKQTKVAINLWRELQKSKTPQTKGASKPTPTSGGSGGGSGGGEKRSSPSSGPQEKDEEQGVDMKKTKKPKV